MSKAAIHKSTFAVPCDTYGCLNRSEYYVGRHDGPRNISHNLCYECAENLVANLPSELSGKLPDPTATVQSLESQGVVLEEMEIDGHKFLVVKEDPNGVIDMDATLNDPDNDTIEPSDDAGGDFECAQCGKTFKTERGLNIHVSQVHEG